MGPGNDPGFAVELATENLANRATKSSYQLAIDAFVNNGERPRACELKRALPPRLVDAVGADLACE